MTTHQRFLSIISLCSVIIFTGCNREEPQNVIQDVSNLHDNDRIVLNNDGTSSVTVANREFTTSQFVLPDDGTASFNVLSLSQPSTYDISSTAELEVNSLLGSFNIRSTNDVSVNNFAVDDGILYAHINSVVTTNANVEVPGIGTLQAALPTEFASILSYSLTANRVISSAAVSSSVSGFAYNGAILLSDLSAEVEFFPVSRATITDAIAPVDPLGEFAVIDAVFLDHDRYYVVSAGRLYSMPLNDVRNSNVVTDIIDRDISQIDAVYFTADETNIYLAVVDGSKTKVQVIDKLAQVASDWPGLINYKVAGMTMDANRIYFGDSLINKPAINAYSLKGDYIDGVELAPSVNLGQIYLAGTALYFINKNDNTLHQSTLSWAP